jgi:hypothetical protein
MRIAAGLSSLFLGLGFGLPGVFGLRHFSQTGQVWTFLGFPTYGGGPFERIGIPTSIVLLTGFLVVCVAEIALGVMLMMDAPGTRIFSIALLPFEFLFWIGFALPFGPPLGVARTILVFLA